MKKIVLLILVIGAAVWYFDLSRKMTEDGIRDSYQEQIDALTRFDPQPLCDSLADGFQGTVSTGGSVQPTTQSKAEACEALTRSLQLLKTLSERTGGRVEPDYDVDIKSVTLSHDRKQATVELDSVMRLGDATLARTHSVEHLIKRNGRILETDSEDSVWTYRPQ